MLKRLVAVLVALVVGTAVIYGGVSLYKMRHEMFRPDVRKAGGTEVAFDVAAAGGQAPDEDEMEQACRVLRKRFDDTGVGGVEVRHDGAKRLVVVVPNGRHHDALVSQARRLAFERGRTELRLIANPDTDKDALAAAEKQFMAMKGVPIKPGEVRGTVVAVGEGADRKRYRWFRLHEGQAREWTRHSPTARKGKADRWVATSNYNNAFIFGVDPAAGLGSPSHFVLCVEPDEMDRIGGEGIERVRIVGKDSRTSGRLEFTFTEEAAARLRKIGSISEGGRRVLTNEMPCLACVVDGEVVFGHDLFRTVLRKQTFALFLLPSEVDDVAALIRGGELTLKLDRASVKENPVAPRR